MLGQKPSQRPSQQANQRPSQRGAAAGPSRHPLELSPEQLKRITNPETLGFETTRNLPTPPHMVGQSRAEEAIDFALEMRDSRYNLFVAGHPGTGRQTAVEVAVERVARDRPAPMDWCYGFNFDSPDEPRALALPPGRARAFARDIEALVQGCRRELHRVFGADTYSRRRAALLKDVADQHRRLLDALDADSRRLGFVIEESESGIAVIPLRPNEVATNPAQAQALSREEYDALPEAVRDAIDANREPVRELLDRTLPQLKALQEEARARVRKLNREVADDIVRPRIEELAQSYTSAADAVEYLRALGKDLLAHADQLRGEESDAADLASRASEGEGPSMGPGAEDGEGGDDGAEGRSALGGIMKRYRLNVFVSHKPEDHAPVVHEINPTRGNLVGRIEAGLRNGLPYSDHTMIKPGALHRANGGFLILQAMDLLRAPHAYEALKRVLRFEMLTLDGGEREGGPPGSVLRPEPIPAALRVILIGDYSTFTALLELDPEFRQLFKVRADFDVDLPRNREGETAYAHYVGDVARTTSGAPLSNDAVAVMIEEGSRWAEDQEKLSALFGELRDLTMEACHWAKKEGAEVAVRRHVARAIIARERRLSLLSDKLDEQIAQGTVEITTSGSAVGQSNALTVLSYNDFAFGKPSRITASVSPGQAGLVNIEREIGASGASHSKGVLVLNGYLLGRFGQEFPPSLSATLTFEQVHSEVDGDSASSSELFALLSALANVPLKQTLAVTGAVNLRGEIQAVGGVTHKVEAFFRLCRARGLTGDQGVLLPRSNVRNLMLREDVIEAVRAGSFHLYAVGTVDEAMELLTGMPSGAPDRQGRFADNTLNGKVLATLRSYTQRVKAHAPATVRR